MKDRSHADPVMKIFQPFVYDARVSLSITALQGIPIKILRDTGASQSLILTNTLPFSTQSYSGKNVLIKGVHSSEYSPIPLHNIKLHSDLVSGDVVIGIIDSLPFDGIQLILGNDLAGEKVTVNPVLSNTPCTECIPVTAEQEIPDLYPSCAVTRAMSKQQISNDKTADEYELSDTFIAHIFDNADEVKSTSKSNLIDAQKSDPEIASLIAQACDEKEIAEHAIGYYVKNGILMRKWRPTDVCVGDKLAHLPPSQRKDPKKILQEHEDLFPDVPSRTNAIYHDVDIVNDASPIKQHSYRLSPAKQKSLKDEI